MPEIDSSLSANGAPSIPPQFQANQTSITAPATLSKTAQEALNHHSLQSAAGSPKLAARKVAGRFKAKGSASAEDAKELKPIIGEDLKEKTAINSALQTKQEVEQEPQLNILKNDTLLKNSISGEPGKVNEITAQSLDGSSKTPPFKSELIKALHVAVQSNSLDYSEKIRLDDFGLARKADVGRFQQEVNKSNSRKHLDLPEVDPDQISSSETDELVVIRVGNRYHPEIANTIREAHKNGREIRRQGKKIDVDNEKDFGPDLTHQEVYVLSGVSPAKAAKLYWFKESKKDIR